MTFDRRNNDGNTAPDMVIRQSLGAFRTDPPRDLSIRPAYEMSRLGMEMQCALPPDFTPPALQLGSQDAPLSADFNPYAVWNLDRK